MYVDPGLTKLELDDEDKFSKGTSTRHKENETNVMVAGNWSEKGKRRKTTGTGRMRSLGEVSRRFKNGFQTGAPKGTRNPVNA